MKKILFILTMMLTVSISTAAMSYEQARREALFLTDKMAYELNLNEQQYDAAYEINLDYLMGVTGVDNVYGNYWTRRNLDMSYILLDWQWNAFRAASYFYRPLYFSAGAWHFGIYARYPHRHYLYFNHPTVYVSYRGAHGWRHYGERSYYYNLRNHYRTHVKDHGMRDRWDRGDFKHNHKPQGNFKDNNRKEYGRPIGNRPNNNKDNGYKSNNGNKPNNNHQSSGFKPNNQSSGKVNNVGTFKRNDSSKPIVYKKVDTGNSKANVSSRPNTNNRPTFNSRPSGSPKMNAVKGNSGNGTKNNGNKDNKNGAFGGRR